MKVEGNKLFGAYGNTTDMSYIIFCKRKRKIMKSYMKIWTIYNEQKSRIIPKANMVKTHYNGHKIVVRNITF
jgi:hypothetical protein